MRDRLEQLIAGMVDNEVLDTEQLRRLAKEIEEKSQEEVACDELEHPGQVSWSFPGAE